MATHDVLPFTLVFLAIAAAVEASACLDHWLSERWLAAAAADLAVLLATWLVTNERGLPDGYAPIPHGWLLAAQVALLAIYLSSTIVRTLLPRLHLHRVRNGAVRAGLSPSAWAAACGSRTRRRLAVGTLALACGAACYVVSFARLDRSGSRGRNFYTYSTFGILLALAGSRILLPGGTASAVWSALAVACVWAGGALRPADAGGARRHLPAAGAGVVGRAAAGGRISAGRAKMARRHGRPPSGWARWPHCYVTGPRPGTTGGKAQRLDVPGIPFRDGGRAGMAVGRNLRRGVHRSVPRRVRSGCQPRLLRHAANRRAGSAALLLAWAGARWGKLELSRLIYPLMVVGAYRLLVDDLHQDRKAALFLSLLVYGAALMALPRLNRGRRPAAIPVGGA